MTYLRRREILPTALLLLFTCGFYQFYWIIVAITELNQEQVRLGTKTKVVPPVTAILLGIITCGIYLFYAFYTWSKAIEEIGEINNYRGAGAILTFVLFMFFAVGGTLIAQSDMNQIVELSGVKTEATL